MPGTLIFRPQPYGDEGLNGYLLRLADGNRIAQIKSLWKGGVGVQDELAKLLGKVDIAWSERLFRQSDQKGNRPMWNSSTSRFCPDCLRALNYWKQDWELSLMSACPIHRCLLLEVCSNCQRTLHWRRKSLLHCHCGSDLRRMHTEPADDKEIELAQTLSNKLHGQDSEIPNLQPLNLKQTHSLLVTLGVYANPERRIDLRNQSINSQSSARSLVLSASNVLFNWPGSFHQMLDQIQKVSEKKYTARLGKRFGKFYEYLYTNYKGPEFGFLMHEFENYLENNWKHAIAARNKRLSGRLRNGHIWVPAHTMAVELNVSRKAIASLIETGEIDSSRVTTTKGREVICINRLQRELIQSLIHDRVDLKMAAELLGLKENRVCQLYEHHLLGKVISAKENASGRWQLSRCSLEQILILGANLPVADADHDLIGLRHLLHYVLNKPFLFPRLLMAVMKREILPVAVCKQERGLTAWQFKRSHFKRWHIEQLKGSRKGAFTIPEAACIALMALSSVAMGSKSALLQFKESGVWFFLDQNEASGLISNWTLKATQCDGSKKGVRLVAQLTEDESNVICESFKDKGLADYLQKTVRTQRIFSGYIFLIAFGFIFSIVKRRQGILAAERIKETLGSNKLNCVNET